MNVRGIGNDILEIDRVRKSYETYGNRFLSKLFSPKEQEYCLKFKDPAPRLAARFSAKESVVKALGTGFGKYISWLDIEILNDDLGKPCVFFSESAKKTFNNPQVLLTISHSKLYVSTVALHLD
jgi:holo-[acyl-carrier protein] synthase